MIDSHAHLWRLGENGCSWPTAELEPIHRDFTIDDLRPVAAVAGVDGIILVQSQEDERDTEWLLSLGGHPLVAGVVGWTDFEAADAPASIAMLAEHESLVGLRPMVQNRASDWFDSPGLNAAFEAMAQRKLVLDALVRPRHLRSLRRMSEGHPHLTIVIDHAAKPDFTDLVGWRDQMARLARLPNVACKLSGLLTEFPPGAPPQAIEPVFDMLWDSFGAERLLWGSDWPVLTLAGTYASWLQQAKDLVPAEHHPAVFDSNARGIYRIAP